MKDLVLKLALLADGSRWASVLGKAGNHTQSFGRTVRREFDSMRNAARSLEGRMASLGISIGAVMLLKQSAHLDKGLIRIGRPQEKPRRKSPE